jgi:hypothetical protein
MSTIAKRFFCVRELSQVEAEPLYPDSQTSTTVDTKVSTAEPSDRPEDGEPETLHFSVSKN